MLLTGLGAKVNCTVTCVMGTEAVFPCDTPATQTDLNTDDMVLLWRP